MPQLCASLFARAPGEDRMQAEGWRQAFACVDFKSSIKSAMNLHLWPEDANR
jgi:hypothetical protein